MVHAEYKETQKRKRPRNLIPTKANDHRTQRPAGKPVFIIPAKGQFVNIFCRFCAKSGGIRKKKPGFGDFFAQNATNLPDLNIVFHSVMESRVEKPLFFHHGISCPGLHFLFLVHRLSQKFSTGLWKTMLRNFSLSTARCSEKTFPCRFGAAKEKRSPEWGALVRMK